MSNGDFEKIAASGYGAYGDVVEEGGFEPPKLTQQIYSLPPLATRELLHIQFSRLLCPDRRRRPKNQSQAKWTVL